MALAKKAAFLWLFLAVGPLKSPAYITSATLEYNCDDEAGFYLNGKALMERGGFTPFDYAVLSSSDGTLPLELFNLQGDNLLAVVDYDTKGDNMFVSYRLTLHLSDGPPIVVLSEAAGAKVLHLHGDEKAPENWMAADLNDGDWKPAREAQLEYGFEELFPSLPDFASKRRDALNPRLSHSRDAHAVMRDHDHFRSHFQISTRPGAAQIRFYPPQAKGSVNVAVRLIPEGDGLGMAPSKMLARLPPGLELTGMSPGGQADPAKRQLSWDLEKGLGASRFLSRGVASISKDGGWPKITTLLGREKPGKSKTRAEGKAADILWEEGAIMTPSRPSWFKMEPHGMSLAKSRPVIQGVIFHTQLRLGNGYQRSMPEADAIFLNYSVDGGFEGSLKKDVVIGRCSQALYWFDGYYDATEDRRWTWEELDSLNVKLLSATRGRPDENLAASCVVTVRYADYSGVSPYFYAKVSETKCATLTVNAEMSRAGGGSPATGSAGLPVNQQLCAKP